MNQVSVESNAPDTDISVVSAGRKSFVRNFQILVLLILAFSPVIVISQIIVNEVARDNENYKAFYDAVNGVWSLRDAYFAYVINTGASEPISFLFFYLQSILGVSYSYSVFIKNIAITFILWRLICRYFKFNFLLLTLILYLSTDYYLMRLLSELHRLSLAVMFLLSAALVFDRKFPFLTLSLLCHLQVALFFPLLVFIKKNRLTAIIILSFVGVVLSAALRGKLEYYIDFRPADVVKFFFLSLPFLVICLSTGYKTFKIWTVLTITFIIISGLFGTGRIIILYWEILVAACFITINQKGWRAKKFLVFYMFIYGFVIPYNIFRIFTESSELLG